MAERRILIAIDGSEHSERAFDWYCDNIRHESDVLVLSHTLELPPKPPAPFPYIEGYYENWKKEIELARNDSKNMLAKYQFICEERNIEILNAVHDERYQPGPSICKVAEENNVSLIILGSRGLSKVRRTFMGSISDYVVHHAHLPVCVVPPNDEEYNCVKENKTRSKGARAPSPLPEGKLKPEKSKPRSEPEPEPGPKPETAPEQRREPAPDERAREPAPDERAREPAPEERAREPTPEQRREPAPEERAREPAPEERAREPAPEERAREPAPEERAREPAPEERAREPAPEERAREPAPDERAKEPAPEERAREPAPDERAKEPASEPDPEQEAKTESQEPGEQETPPTIATQE